MHSHPDIGEVLITKQQLEDRITQLAKQISADFVGKRPLVIGILKGSWIFLADLVRRLDLDVDVDFMTVSSYGSGTTTSGQLKVVQDITIPCEGRDILIVEDIVDSGITLSNVRAMFAQRKANSVAIAALLSKPSRRLVDVRVEYIGFDIPDKFVIGFGMDFDQRFRGYDQIGVMKS